MEEVVVLEVNLGSESQPAHMTQAVGDCRLTSLLLWSKMRSLQAKMVAE